MQIAPFMQTLAHLPQLAASSSVLTQTPLHIISPCPMHSPSVVDAVVPVVPSVPVDVDVDVDVEVDVDPPLVDGSSEVEDEVGVVSELVELVDVEVIDEVAVIPALESVPDIALVLDTESVAGDDALTIPVDAPAVLPPPRSSPPQAKRAKPTRVDQATGAVAVT